MQPADNPAKLQNRCLVCPGGKWNITLYWSIQSKQFKVVSISKLPCCCCSGVKLCLTPCDLMGCSFVYQCTAWATIWMGLEGIMLSQISQTENREMQYDLTYLWNLKSKTNKIKLIDTETRLVVTRGEGVGAGWMGSTVWWWMVTRFIVVITLQYTEMFNYNFAQLKCIYCIPILPQ